MRFFLLVFIIGSLFFKNSWGYDLETKYIDIPLDHFSFSTNKTFKLKYLINDTYFKENGPIFFYTGNEGSITTFADNTGFMFDIYQKFNALLVFAEHRYYGESLPFGNLSYSKREYLGYLSSQQALADFVYLLNDLQTTYGPKHHHGQKLPVIAFGGSYGGMLAAWIRMKYPYAVTGAIAASAPILQFKGLTPCQNFNKIVTDVYRSIGSQQCEETLRKTWAAIRDQTKNDQGKVATSLTFHLCKNMTKSDDIEKLISWFGEILVNLVMANYPYPANFLAPLPGHPVKEFCNRLESVKYTDNSGLLKAVATGLEVYTNYTKTTKCNDILAATSSDIGETGWNFQSCTDMVMPMCSTDEDLFENTPYNFTQYSEDCFKQFSVRPKSEDVPILEYGGADLKTASNIVFSNGLLDPWSSGGVLKNVSAGTVSIIIPDAAHHFDLRSENSLDSDSVKNARKFHVKQIAHWLKEYYFNNFKSKHLWKKMHTIILLD